MLYRLYMVSQLVEVILFDHDLFDVIQWIQ